MTKSPIQEIERVKKQPFIRRQLDLSLRLNLWYTAYFITGALLLFAFSYLLLVHELVENDREIVRAKLDTYQGWYAAGGAESLKEHFQSETISERESTYVQLRGPKHVSTLSFFPGQQNPLPQAMKDELERLEDSATPTNQPAWTSSKALGQNMIWNIAYTRMADGSELEVGKTAEDREILLGRFRSIFLFVLIPMGLLGFGVGAIITYSALAPIRGIISAVQRILDTGDRTARVPRPNTEDELDELVTLFNEMLDRNERLIQAMRDSLDHMAHDMRTPLTRLRGEAELALTRNDPAQMEEALADAIEESDRLSDMLKTIMDISEAESGASRMDMANFHLEPLVQSLFDLYEGVAEDRGILLEMKVDSKGLVYADRNRLQMVLSNLLDNAIKYTPNNSNGKVAVFAEFGKKVNRIVVKDSGQGISPEDMPRIWERLYRGDQSRSQRGLGLGLSLVRALVEAQGGKVTAESVPGKGSLFIIMLPKKSQTVVDETGGIRSGRSDSFHK